MTDLITTRTDQDEAIAERRTPSAPAPMPMVGLLLLDARQQMIEGGPR